MTPLIRHRAALDALQNLNLGDIAHCSPRGCHARRASASRRFHRRPSYFPRYRRCLAMCACPARPRTTAASCTEHNTACRRQAYHGTYGDHPLRALSRSDIVRISTTSTTPNASTFRCCGNDGPTWVLRSVQGLVRGTSALDGGEPALRDDGAALRSPPLQDATGGTADGDGAVEWSMADVPRFTNIQAPCRYNESVLIPRQLGRPLRRDLRVSRRRR